ncbi:MAG TPA: ribosome biogenesis GTP-binding protein YihA/YsxC [Candidatus Ozemobacteraceae bacterium]|nr:ribosome biogenesis GTP-binding protein YihA/YsxC [Candidatus Ozemobacteraceae bacterium]
MTVKVTSAVFNACVTSKDALPTDGLPVIALVGRSNVGKSSLINNLAGRRELAKTSSTPGKTLTINFYQFNEAFYIVDLPGYGYAKASKITRERIQKMMDEFFEACPTLKAVVQIIDLRHSPSSLDKQMFKWIQDQNFNYLAILNKADKLSTQQQIRMFRQIMRDLHTDGPGIVFSAQTGQGKDDVLEAFVRLAAGEEIQRSVSKPRRAERQGDGGRRGRRDRRPGQADSQKPPSPDAPQAEQAQPPAAGDQQPPQGQGQGRQRPQGGGQGPLGPRREGQHQQGHQRRRDRNRRNAGQKTEGRDKAPQRPNDLKPEGGESK